MTIRRVVSARSSKGKDAVVSDETLQPVEVAPGGFMYSIWGADEAPALPADGVLPVFRSFFPPAGGYRFIQISIPPDKPESGGAITVSAEAETAFGADLQQAIAEEGSGMHATDTVDLEVVLSGEAGLEFDDGAKLYLKPGDVFVQNGTRHRWFNRGTVPAVVVCVLIGGHARK